jgi:hypothetical protein
VYTGLTARTLGVQSILVCVCVRLTSVLYCISRLGPRGTHGNSTSCACTDERSVCPSLVKPASGTTIRAYRFLAEVLTQISEPVQQMFPMVCNMYTRRVVLRNAAPKFIQIHIMTSMHYRWKDTVRQFPASMTCKHLQRLCKTSSPMHCWKVRVLRTLVCSHSSFDVGDAGCVPLICDQIVKALRLMMSKAMLHTLTLAHRNRRLVRARSRAWYSRHPRPYGYPSRQSISARTTRYVSVVVAISCT